MFKMEIVEKKGTSCRRLNSIPNEDFGRMNKRWNQDVRSTFQGREYWIWATTHWKAHRTSAFLSCSSVQNLRLGSIKFTPPQRTFCKEEQERNAEVRCAFEGREYRFHWKVHRTSAFHLLFIIPKSLFGEHKVEFGCSTSTDTSSCYHHLVSSTDTSSCYHHLAISTRHIVMLSPWNVA